MAEIFANLEKVGIKKKIIHCGKGTANDYEDGTKVSIHINFYFNM